MPFHKKFANGTEREYNDDGFLIHSKGIGGEWWNEYDYELHRVRFKSSTGWETWHYDWPKFSVKKESA
jgi:hypothetical protein